MAEQHDHKHEREGPKKPPKGPKERELAASLTASAIQAAGSLSYTSLDEAADAVAHVYEKMLALVTRDVTKA